MHACAEACAARTPIGRAARLRGCSVLSGDGASLARSHARVGGAERTTPAAIVAARAGAAGRLWAPSEPAGPASPAGRAGARGPWVKPEQASAGLRLARSKPGKHLACGPVRPGIWLRRRGLYSLCACAPEARCVSLEPSVPAHPANSPLHDRLARAHYLFASACLCLISLTTP